MLKAIASSFYSFLSKHTETKPPKKDPIMHIDDLPPELKSDIISRLNTRDQFHMRSMNRSLYNAAQGEIKRVKVTDPDDIILISETFPNVEHLNAQGCKFLGSHHTAAMQKMKRLRSLDLKHNSSINKKILKTLPRQIESLCITNCNNINDDSFSALRRLKRLRHFSGSVNSASVWQYGIVGWGYRDLTRIKTMKSIDITASVGEQHVQEMRNFLDTTKLTYKIH